MGSWILSFMLVGLTCLPGSLGHAKMLQGEYEMRGTETDLWDYDVDYFSTPITLYRLESTYPLHRVQSEVLRYETRCVSWQQVCVSHDSQGHCTSYENRCMQYSQDTYPVTKRIELDFTSLTKLGEKETETYRLDIQRQKPAGDGEDYVYVWLSDVKTKVPVVVRKFGTYQYRIDPK
jgi:hypothetical protein